METTIDEVGDRLYRLSTFVEAGGLVFNQYLLDGDEPFLFHCGHRRMFPQIAEALGRVRPVEELRWISFGHVEADEAGSLNSWLAAAPQAEVAFGAIGCLVSVDDLADRPPRPMDDGEVLAVGDRRLRYLATPHVPHNWEAGLWFDETTSTLLCGDLFTTMGPAPATTESDVVEPAIASLPFAGMSTVREVGDTLRRLAGLEPTTLALMHGPTYLGDGAAALRALADHLEVSQPHG
jgi:flavorubredoxin